MMGDVYQKVQSLNLEPMLGTMGMRQYETVQMDGWSTHSDLRAIRSSQNTYQRVFFLEKPSEDKIEVGTLELGDNATL